MSIRIAALAAVLACFYWVPAQGDGTGLSLTMEGQTHELDDVSLRNSSVTLQDGQIQFYITQDEHPVSLNFNLSDNGILEQGSGSYQVPEANHSGATVDLNFFNKDRPGRRLARRVVFDQGTITIEEISSTSLRMRFEGSGHPLMDDDLRFPIEGRVDVKGLREVRTAAGAGQ